MRAFICLCFISLCLIACRKDRSGDAGPSHDRFSVNSDYILKNGKPFPVKGTVYVPGYPGFLPWQIEGVEKLPKRLEASIDHDLVQIKAMGANTIRLWGAPLYCYQAIDSLGGLYILQTIWFDGEAPDFQDQAFKVQCKEYIKAVVDRIYQAFAEKPPILAFMLGNELSAASIRATNQAHPNLKSYEGLYIKTDTNRNASEVFIAEMADFLLQYQDNHYGERSLVSYGNEIRTHHLIETPFLDFICHNAYSYAVPYYRPTTKPGSSSGTLFQGWIEGLKSRQPDIPLLISETGLSVSPNKAAVGPPNYGYGGNTEEDQKEGIIQNLNDIASARDPIAGVCVHEYLDAWWKFGYHDSYSQDPNDIEEWFGLVKLKAENDWYSTEARPAYYALQARWVNN